MKSVLVLFLFLHVLRTIAGSGFKSPPHCNAIYVRNTGEDVESPIVVMWRCSISYVNANSPPSCVFTYEMTDDRGVMTYSDQVSSDHVKMATTSKGRPLYYDKECSMTLPVTSLPPGTYKFTSVWSLPFLKQVVNSSDVGLNLAQPLCTNAILFDNNRDISITCHLSIPYAKIACQLQVSKANGAFYNTTVFNETTSKLCVKDPPTCVNRCTLTKAINSLEFGDYRFRLLIKPVITKGMRMNKHVISDASESLHLTPPVTAIQNCPHGHYVREGYIKQGTVATCECDMKTISQVPAQAEWHNSKGEKVGRGTANGVSILTIQPRPENKDESYTCVGVSLDRQGPQMIYQPKIAYGPSNVHVEINGGNKTFLMCNDDTAHVQVSVATDSVNPKPDIFLGGLEDHQIVSQQESVQGKFYIYDYKVTPKNDSNLLHIKVIATNPMFSQMVAYNYDYTSIIARPSSSPVLTLGDDNGSPIVNGSSQPVAFGDFIMVRCKVPGAVSNVNKVTIKCFGGVLSKSDGGTHTSLGFRVEKAMDKQKCTCITHDGPSGCYNLKTEFVLRVNYPPSSPPIMTVTGAAQGPGNTRAVSQGQKITINCRVTGGRPEVRSVYIVCGSRRKEGTGTETTLVLRVRKEMNGQKCLCGAHHVTGNYIKMAEFTLDVHFPPSSPPVLTIDGGPPVIKGRVSTVDAGQTIKIECHVDGGNPKVSAVRIACEKLGRIETANATTMELKVDEDMNGERCTCMAYHVTHYKKRSEFTLNVRYPPSSPPVLTVDNGDPVINGSVETLDNGQMIVIRCRVDGGQPLVNSVYITCAGRHEETTGTFAAMYISVDKKTNGNVCSCGAIHETGSYQKRTEVTLHVLYIPLVKTFTANSFSNSLEVSEGDKVNLLCEAIGNPRPNPQFFKQHSQLTDIGEKVTSVGSDTSRLQTTLQMGCRDSGTFFCYADHGQGHAKNITVSVKCSPQFAFGNVVKEFYRNSGDDLPILFSVKAYPEPTRFVLRKMETNKVYRGVRNTTYNVVYTRSRPTIGQIMLHMFGPTDGMSGQYKLTISNGVGHGLDYNFNVITRKTTVTKFTANDLSPSAEVSKGDTVTFTCEVNGDTTHNLLLTGQRSNISLLFKDVIHGIGTKRSEITKTVTCNDTDVYTCAADDDDTGNSHKTVSVFVICPPELTVQSEDQDEVVVQTMIGSNVRLEIDVNSYPQPNKFVLIKLQQDWRKSEGNARGTVMDRNLYNVTYTSKSRNEGTVLLEMVMQQKNNRAHYVLSIRNGVGKGMHYIFQVIKVSASKDTESNNSIFGNIRTTDIVVACSILLILACVVAVLIVVRKRRKARQKRETADAAVLRFDNQDYMDMAEVHRPRKQQVDSCGYEMPRNKSCEPNVYANIDGTDSEHLSGACGGASPGNVVGACCKDGDIKEDYDDEWGEGGYMDIDCAKASAKEYEKKMNQSEKCM